MKMLYVFLALAVFYFGADYLVSIKPTRTSDEYANWALALLALNLLPSLHFLLFRNKNVPLVPLVGLFYVLSCSLPVFFVELEDYQLGTLDIEALKLSFWGLFTFYGCYYVSYSRIKNIGSFNPVPGRYINSTMLLRILLYAFLMSAVLGKFYPIGGLRHFYEPSIYIFAGLFIYLYYNNKLSKIEIIFFLSLLGLELTSRLAGSLLAKSAKYLLFISMIYYLVRRRIPYIGIILSVTVYSLLLPVKFEFRKIEIEEEGRIGTRERLEIFYDLAVDHYLESKKREKLYGEDENERSVLWRFSYSISALSLVMELTPTIVPYWEGYTYSTLYSKLIPRFLWPDKPTEDIGQEFGHRYHILDDSDDITSMNLPWIAELYANWGRKAVFYGMAIFGIFFGFIDRYYNSGTNTINIILSAAIFFPMITQESHFAREAGNIFLLTVAIYFFVKFITANIVTSGK